MCSFRIFAYLLSRTVASTSLPLLVLGGMVAMGAEAKDDEGVKAADEWGDSVLGSRKKTTAVPRLEKTGGNEQRLCGSLFMGKERRLRLFCPCLPRRAFNECSGGVQ